MSTNSLHSFEINTPQKLRPLNGHYSELQCDAILNAWPRNGKHHWHWVDQDNVRMRVLDLLERPNWRYRAIPILPV